MAFGSATFLSQHLELGEFAAPDHAGSSISSLRSRLDSFYSGSTSLAGTGWDPKKKLQNAISDLKIDEWGLDYDNFKPSHVDNQSNRVPDLA